MLSCLPEKNFEIMKNLSVQSVYTEKKIFKICQSHSAKQRRISKYLKNVNLLPIKREEIRNNEKIFNVVPLNGEEFRNAENISNFVSINGKEFLIEENIFNIVQLNGEEIENDIIFVNLILLKRGILKLCKICQCCQKMEKNFEIMKNNQSCLAKQRKNSK